MKHLAIVILATLMLAACGGSTDDQAAPDAGTLPACADVWVPNATLPSDYKGCVNDDGSVEAAAIQECGQGQPVIRWASYDDRFYAYLDGQVIAISGADDPVYADFYRHCTSK